jgi:solute carrier family 35, member E1
MPAIDIPLLSYFALWYLGNYYYNIQNKRAANAAGGSDFAMTIATAQLAVGAIYAIFLWVAPEAREAPKLTLKDWIKCLPVGICSAAAHAASVFSLSAGGVAFGQIVKAAEPAFAAVIGTIFYKQKVSLTKWLCLIPIIGGVCCAALNQKKDGSIELDFTIGGLVGALIANVFASFKGAENKKLMTDPDLKARMGSVGNQFAVMTLISLLVSIPLMIFKEGNRIQEFVTKFNTIDEVKYNVIYSGVTFYMYNELATMTLKKISPVANSVANTAKRVVVIVGSAIVFNEKITTLKAIGCAICIGGVFVDSLLDASAHGKDKKH